MKRLFTVDSYVAGCELPPRLSSRQGLFEGLLTDAAGMTLATGPLVEHFNLIEDIRPGHIQGFIYAFPDSFFFQRTKQ